MSAKIIDGKAFAENLRKKISEKVSELKDKHNITPGLAVILVGEDPASQVYVASKGKQTNEVGMNSYEFKLPTDVSEADLLKKVDELNKDKNVNGILVQLPLPKHIDEFKIINAIAPEKDVDGFTIASTGRLTIGMDTFVSCTPLGCLLLLKDALGKDLSGKNAVIIGRSNIVGKPMASLLLKESCTVTIAHSKTKNLPEVCKSADILVAAVGRPKMVKGDWIKPGATVIDVGINRIEIDGKNKLVGDVDFDDASRFAGAITPVPGGVGPMTIACLLLNTLKATIAYNKLPLSLSEII